AQIGVGRGPAATVFHRHMHGSEAFLPGAVVVIRLQVPRVYTRPDKRLVQRVAHVVAVVHAQRAGVTAVVIASEGPGFRLFEVRQYVLIVPTGGAFSLPFVEIPGMAPYIHHAVDGG